MQLKHIVGWVQVPTCHTLGRMPGLDLGSPLPPTPSWGVRAALLEVEGLGSVLRAGDVRGAALTQGSQALRVCLWYFQSQDTLWGWVLSEGTSEFSLTVY